MIERDRALLHPWVLLWPVLLVDYEVREHPSGNGVYEVAGSSAASTNDVDIGIVGRHDNTASGLSTERLAEGLIEAELITLLKF